MATERQILNLSEVLTHALAFQATISPVHRDACLYNRHRLKDRLDKVIKECELLLSSWVDKHKYDTEEELNIKELMSSNLANFYQVFQMVMNLSAEDIDKVRIHLLTDYYSKPEYEDKKSFIL